MFRQSPEQLRRIGARGGKSCVRNRCARLRATPPVAPAVAAPNLPLETTAQALAALDAKFPWLREAETRRSLSTTLPAASHR